MKGIITAIQRMSIHDGPGIRSTLFMKGCNMRCRWCHNPETWSRHKQLQYVVSKCIHCGLCVGVCSREALSVRPDVDKLLIDRQKCDVCGRCTEICSGGALSLVGREVEIDEVMEQILDDMPFYKESGGGVTISGGEPLLQKKFVAELLSACRLAGIGTAVETNLNVEWDDIHELLPLVDVWMCDLKIADSSLHKEWTGTGNEKILVNLKLLAQHKVPLIVRTPVIPGVNDSRKSIGDICGLMQGMDNIVYYELLPFHSLGFDKYEMLGMNNSMLETRILNKKELLPLYEVAVQNGIKIKDNIL